MLLGHVMIRAVDAALKERKETLSTIDVDVTSDIFSVAVVDGLMASVVAANRGVGRMLIRHQDRGRVDVLAHGNPQSAASAIVDDFGSGGSITLNHSYYRNMSLGGVSMRPLPPINVSSTSTIPRRSRSVF